MNDDVLYQQAKDDPVASIILDALHTQDARTYNGDAGDKGKLALSTAEAVQAPIRRDERERLAALFEEHAEVLAGFAPTTPRLVEMMCFLLRLDHGVERATDTDNAAAQA